MSIRINGVDVASTINERSNEEHGTYHLAATQNLYELQRSNNFEFVVTDLDGILRAGMNGNESNAYIANAQETLRLAVESTQIPHFSQNVLEKKRGNNILKYAGVPTFENTSISFADYIGADTVGVLMAWQNLSYNVKTEKVGICGDYKKDCYLVEYSPDYQEVRRWKLYGCWISALSEDAMDVNATGEHKVSATIPYDRAELDTSNLI